MVNFKPKILGRTSDLQMVKIENLQLNILEVSEKNVSFEVILKDENEKHTAKIVNHQGIFGVEFPKEVSLLLSYYPKETKRFIAELRKLYFSAIELQAA